MERSVRRPGRDLFYDTVHLTFAGHYIVARAAFEQTVHALPERIKAQAKPDAAIPSEHAAEARDWLSRRIEVERPLRPC